MKQAIERSFYKIATPKFDKITDNTKSLAQSLKNIGEGRCSSKVASLQH